MIKYYEELETPDKFTLPLVEKNCSLFNIEEDLENNFLLSFFNKYKYLLKTIKEVDLLLETIDMEKISQKIMEKKDNLNEQDKFENYFVYGQLYKEFLEIKEALPRMNQILKVSTEMVPLIQYYGKALSIMVYFYPELKSKWGKALETFFDSLNSLREMAVDITAKYNRPANIEKNYTLTNNWYITSYGDLYNAGGEKGHKETSLIEDYKEISRSNLDGKSIEEYKKSTAAAYLRISKNGFIDYLDFLTYLHYNCDFVVIPSLNKSYGYPRTYDPKIVRTILGILSARENFYNFFVNMQNYTSNTKKELNKLIEMTRSKDNLCDILVRCAGFYKIETSLNKTITTSSLTPFEDLQEYIKKGWDVCCIPPIIINRENGLINELNINSPIVERYIEKDIKKYEKSKQPGYGRIY